jgi:peptidoglycan-associated lipoprotein
MHSAIGSTRRTAHAAAVLGLVLLLAAAGCSGKKPDDEVGSGIGSSEFDTGMGSKGEREGEMSEPERVRELASIYFDFDSSDIRADARPTLQSNAQAIQAHSEWRKVTLEGHTDERGSEEYNLALGERRANATKQYLVDLGVPSSRLQTVSFGASTPAVQGHDESAWRWNRRTEFRVTR